MELRGCKESKFVRWFLKEESVEQRPHAMVVYSYLHVGNICAELGSRPSPELPLSNAFLT